MATHLIIYGHGAGDPGAVGNGENERDFNRKKLHPFIKKWADKSKDSFVFFDTSGNRDMFQETAQGWGMYSIKANQYQTINEFHEDAASSSATGGHVIVSSSLKADNVDLNTAQIIKKLVGWWGGVANTKGISYRSNLLNLNVAAKRGLNYRLSELGFITSSRDMSIIKKELDQYAKGIVESITGEKFDSKPVEPQKPSEPANKRPRQKIETYWYGKESPKYKQIKKYLKDNNLKHTESVGTDGRIKIIISSFNQDSDSKYKLEKYLSANDMNFIVDIA